MTRLAASGPGDPAEAAVPTFAAGPIRVLLAELPELMAQVIGQTVAAEADMELVGHARNNWELLQMAGEGIDVIVLGATEVYPPPGICNHLLAELPSVKILVVDPNGRVAVRYWLALQWAKTELTTWQQLVTNIRTLAVVDGGF